ncbi:MAG: MotA/TolQ/ExbB proton channel family protein [Phycisphaerales bacterium]|nr:MotA/TolQ/ExbB proton channel family protein [Phycisphaerae bacterium]NNF43317.1 MotA/TolQ/ExbB proton channel family protein [Phycisphaerales bacterium]NNM25556.1 MotA/TolQ/ExbB proton channel family protein [Phycisphaerales bacterium]
MAAWFDNITGVMLAQAEPAAAAGSAVQVQSVWDFILKGGWMMLPIGLCSLVAMTVVAERLISLRRGKVIPSAFLPGLKKTATRFGHDPRRLAEYCRRDGSTVAHIFLAGVRRLGAPIEAIERNIQEAGQRQVLQLRKHLRVLSVIAAVSPLLGLLGTIFGMIIAFQTVATSAEALGKTELLATGIYQAMITTAAGLIVAIPALICYHWLSSKVVRLVMDIDEMTLDFFEDVVGTAPAPAIDLGTDGAATEDEEPAAGFGGMEAGVAAT